MTLRDRIQPIADELWSPRGPLAEFPLWVQFLIGWLLVDVALRYQFGSGYPGELPWLLVAFVVGVAALATYTVAEPSGYAEQSAEDEDDEDDSEDDGGDGSRDGGRDEGRDDGGDDE